MKLNFNNSNLKKFGKVFGVTLLSLYILFLILPLILSPIANSYSSQVEDIIKTTTGFDAKIEGLGVVTSPKLSAGVKVKDFTLSVPASEKPFIAADNFQFKLALLPLLIKKVQIDEISVKSVDGEILVKKDGNLQVLDYLPKTDNQSAEPMTSLPYGLKLSNHLPNLSAKKYKLAFVDANDNKSYFVEGEKLKVRDFVLNKKVKLSTKGKIVFAGSEISNFDIKIFNKIMPDLQLDDLVFPKDIVVEDVEAPVVEPLPLPFNVIDIFKAVHNNKLHGDLFADVKTSRTLKNINLKGHLKAEALSVAVNGKSLPESYADLTFKGSKTDIDSIFFSSSDENEKTQIIGSVNTGKRPSVDLTFRSNAQFNNIIRLIDSVAKSFGVDDFSTLSAVGGIDADFNINSDMKKVSSTGYLKVKPSKLTYGLYNIVIDKITADIDMMNNNINIANAGFSVLGHPLKLSGTIESNAKTDLRLTADKLSIKGLLLALGQVALLKENNINNGTLSLNALFKGTLKDLKPDVTVNVDNLDIYNNPSELKISLLNTVVKLICDKKTLAGDIGVKSLVLTHPSATVSVPDTKIVMDSKDINIKNSYIMLNNSRIDVKGSVKNYIKDKMSMYILAEGKIAASDIAGFIPAEVRSMFPYAGKLPLSVVAKGNSKVQDICVKLIADSSNYIKLLDIDALNGKNTKIHTDMKISGDTLTFVNSGIFAGEKSIASLNGGISKLYSSPKLKLGISVPQNISFPIPGLGQSNITANGNVSVTGDIMNPQMKGTVNVPDISIKDMDFVITNLVAHLNGSILNGNATADKFKFGGIAAENLSSKVSLVNYNNFYLTDINADAFDGKVAGKVSYGISDASIGVEFSGKGLDSTKAIYGAAGIKNALTGLMGFNAKLVMKGVTDKEIIQSMRGNINFNIDDGKFLSIGRLENLVTAQNVSSNSILKSALGSLSTLATVQEADKYKSITGELNIANGMANISNIKVAGPLMAYYVSGVYNILSNTANIIILGRLEAKVVSSLGVLGDLSAEKILSYIPKFGAITSNILKNLTADPASENTQLIPALTNGSTKYKDFKVVFNGPVESSSSVRSFKWLSQCEIEKTDVKQELQDTKEAVKNNINNQIETTKTNVQNVKNNINNIVETHKNRTEAAKQNFEQSKADFQKAKENSKQNVENLKNLFKNAAQNSQKKVPSSEVPAQE